MRALFTSIPAYGHLHNLVPLALELVAKGHHVAFATSASFGSLVRSFGFTPYPFAFDFDGLGELWEVLKERGEVSQDVQQPLAFSTVWTPRALEDLPSIVDNYQPDIIIRDPMEFGGCMIAEVREIPHVNVTWAYHISKQRAYATWGDSLNDIRVSLGLLPDPDLEFLNRYLAIDAMPPSWHSAQLPRPRVAHAFKVTPFDHSSGETIPDWVATLPYPKTVFVSLGTTFNCAPETFQAIIDGLRHEQINLIVAIGRSMDPSQFGSQPDHIRIVQYIPQTLLFPYCDAIVFHGGYNTLLTTLVHGLAVVVIPQMESDQLVNSRRCAEMGIGIFIEENPPNPDRVRDAVRVVLEDPSYRNRASELRSELQALPDLSEAVNLLDRLVMTREPQFRE